MRKDFSVRAPEFSKNAVAAAGSIPVSTSVQYHWILGKESFILHYTRHLNCGFGDIVVHATATVPAQENKPSKIVAAFQSATNNALISLGGQLETRCFLEKAQSDN